MSNPVKIDFVSDVACPWCAIGLASLERAIAAVGDGLQVEVRFQPFEGAAQAAPFFLTVTAAADLAGGRDMERNGGIAR